MNYFSRQTRRPVSPRQRTAQPRLEPLEARQLLSGFGPEDGAYIVEAQLGRFEQVRIQSTDQKIVAGGTVVVGNGAGVALARYDSVGNPDASYGSGGMATKVGALMVGGLIIQPDGKAVVTSGSYGGGDLRLDRFDVDGSPDASFGNGGSTTVSIQAGSDVAIGVGLQSTGKIVVAGNSTSSPTSAYNESYMVSRFTTNGALDSGKGAFGQTVRGTPIGYTLTSLGGKSQIYNGLVVQPDDKLVAAGRFNPNGGNSQLVVARYTATGTLDKTFNGKGYSVLALAGISISASGVVMQPDGKFVVSGFSSGTDGGDMLVVRFHANGTLDTSFGGGSGYVSLDIDGSASSTQEQSLGVVIQPDGKIVVAGDARIPALGSVSNVLVARLNTNGTLDGTFGTGGFKLGSPLAGTGYHDFYGRAVALQSDGSIIVAGYDCWDTTSNSQHLLLMRFFSGTQSSPLQAAGGAAPAASDTEPLTLAQMQPLRTEAVARRQTAGADVSGLESFDDRITNLPGATVGHDSSHTISLDSNAADWGWLVGRSSRRGRVPQAGRVDLVSALTTR